ncbi:leucine-rich repeat-containing protein 71 [Anableps anableps]
MSRKKHLKDKASQEDEGLKNSDLRSQNEALPVQTFDDCQCTGNVEVDFPMLCALLNLTEIPTINITHQASSTDETGGGVRDDELQISTSPLRSTPCLNIELENEDPLSARKLRISGWKVSDKIFRAIQKMLLSMNQLQSLQFWQAGLTDPMVISLSNTSLCANLRAVTLEGNPLPEQSFHLLLSEDSVLTHLSLRNNRIGDDGARLIGSALSTSKSANKNLLSLNLAFNNIGDAGAAHIAQGLRLNRTLLILSLSNNKIGDSGAAHLAAILGEFALTHEEIVERRRLLLQRIQASSVKVNLEQVSTSHVSFVLAQPNKVETKPTVKKKQKAAKKDEKPVEIKEKSHKKIDGKGSQTKNLKPGSREKLLSSQEDKSSTTLIEHAENVETGNPLLDQSVNRRDRKLFLPGNMTLASLNLAGNKITEKSLPLFLASLEKQEDVGGNLQRLCLQRNLFPPDSECYTKIKEMKALTDPLVENSSEQTEEGEKDKSDT